MDKKAQVSFMAVVYIVGALFVILFLGVLFAIGSGVINWTFDEAIPEFSNLGVVGEWNASSTSNLVLTPVNSFVQSLSFLGGVLYVLGLIGVIGLAFVYRNFHQKWLIPLFFGMILLLVIASIFISNSYEEFYIGTDDVATRLQEQTILSFMILYSPTIMALIGLIAGAIMFSGGGEEQ